MTKDISEAAPRAAYVQLGWLTIIVLHPCLRDMQRGQARAFAHATWPLSRARSLRDMPCDHVHLQA
jgi:hypothetical protein